MLTLYGIPNCDSCRKARKWLEDHRVAYRFHDLRGDGIDEATVRRWVDAVSWQVLLNTRSSTWRKLNDADRANVDEGKAVALMLGNPTLIKRPVAERGSGVIVGFGEERYRALTG